VPGAAVGDLGFFKNEHVAFAAAAQVIGERASDRAASDDHDPGVPIERCRHVESGLFRSGRCERIGAEAKQVNEYVGVHLKKLAVI
jgi:hypothetical protein